MKGNVWYAAWFLGNRQKQDVTKALGFRGRLRKQLGCARIGWLKDPAAHGLRESRKTEA